MKGSPMRIGRGMSLERICKGEEGGIGCLFFEGGIFFFEGGGVFGEVGNLNL